MSKLRELADELVEDELTDLEDAGVELPANIQARWRRHDGPRKMPREREGDGGRARSKPHRVRRQSE